MATGYPIFKDNLDESLKCKKCQLILKQPVQVSCGHLFCKICWDQIIGEKVTRVCPACKNNGDTQVETLEAFPDNGAQREINRLPVRCPSFDCTWSGSFKEFQNHRASCDGQSRGPEEVEQPPQQPPQQQSQQQAADQDLTGMTARRHDELLLIRHVLNIFCAVSLFHVLCYICYETRAMVNRRLQLVVEDSQLQEDQLESLSGRLKVAEEASYCGKLTWKITNICSRIKTAVSGRVLRSPDLYTNQQGRESYKMKVLLCPNGPEKHLSLFIEAIQGTMDAIMKWPFNAKVTVKFLDQAGQERVNETFPVKFERPGSSGSVRRYGFSKFLSQSSLLEKDGARGSAVDEDSVFIQIKVEEKCNKEENKGFFSVA